MIEWQDDAIVLSIRPYGESSVIVLALTKERGKHAGLVRGVKSQAARGGLQPGDFVKLTWRARLEDHLGVFQIELLRSNAIIFFDDPLRLSGLTAALSICEQALPDREKLLPVFEALLILIEHIREQEEVIWLATYIRWEIGVLGALGFSLELNNCTVTGTNDDLSFVSPKTGRAVSKEVGLKYSAKLLKLPGFLTPKGFERPAEFIDGLDLTGYFLRRHVFAAYNKPTPGAREHFQDRVQKKHGDLV